MLIISLRRVESLRNYLLARSKEAVLESFKDELIEKIKDIPARDLVSFTQDRIELDVRIFNDKKEGK